MMELSIIIVNYNTEKLLQDCLKSIKKYTKGIDYEVIVVDNASEKSCLQAVAKLVKRYPKASLIKSQRNLGYAGGNNLGLRKAKGDYALILNTDTILKENAFKKLLDFARENPRVGVVGPKLLNEDGSDQPSASPIFTLFNVFLWLFFGDRALYQSPNCAKQVGFVMGSAFLVKREAWEKAGLLDENFFMYVEEQEWCYRIKKAGWQIWFYPGAKIYHLVRGSSAGSLPADWRGKSRVIVWIFEGLVYFYAKHFAPWQGSVLKFFLKTKAGLAWGLGVLTNNDYLKETYAKAFKAV